MDLGPHVWQLLQWKRSRVTVVLHEPLDPDLFPSRKALAQAAWKAVADAAPTCDKTVSHVCSPAGLMRHPCPPIFYPRM